MPALPPRNDRRKMFSAIAQCWRRWTGTDLSPIKNEFSEPNEIKDGAEAARLSTPELLSLSSQGLYGSNLLERRMAALNLDPEELARSEPALYRGLQRLCTSCRSPMRC